jgi:NADPH:quinone reductase-like Zn-dependent oxidoreductase
MLIQYLANSNNHEDGSFAEYIMVKADICIKVPSSISMEQAATLGIGITTIGQTLYRSLDLPLPPSLTATPFSILIYGGNTATGSLAIQFAKLSGLEVITTSSPANFPRMKSLGASAVFDYNSPTVGKDIRATTKNKLAYVFDCQSDTGSTAICEQAIGEKGGKIVSLLYARLERADVSSVFTLAYTAFGETFDLFGKSWTADEEELAFSARFWSLAQELLEQGKIKTHPVEVREGGLEGVLQGLDEMRQGKIKGKKLVYRV